jgi:hypothetical protein
VGQHTSQSLDENLHIGLETGNKVLFNMKDGCVLSCVGCNKKNKGDGGWGARRSPRTLYIKIPLIAVNTCGGLRLWRDLAVCL